MPTDMRALQDFDEPDKLKIHANDVITIIEGRSRDHVKFYCSQNHRVDFFFEKQKKNLFMMRFSYFTEHEAKAKYTLLTLIITYLINKSLNIIIYYYLSWLILVI